MWKLGGSPGTALSAEPRPPSLPPRPADDGLVVKKTLVDTEEWKRPNAGACSDQMLGAPGECSCAVSLRALRPPSRRRPHKGGTLPASHPPPCAGSQCTLVYTARVAGGGPVFDEKTDAEPLTFTTDEGARVRLGGRVDVMAWWVLRLTRRPGRSG